MRDLTMQPLTKPEPGGVATAGHAGGENRPFAAGIEEARP